MASQPWPKSRENRPDGISHGPFARTGIRRPQMAGAAIHTDAHREGSTRSRTLPKPISHRHERVHRWRLRSRKVASCKTMWAARCDAAAHEAAEDYVETCPHADAGAAGRSTAQRAALACRKNTSVQLRNRYLPRQTGRASKMSGPCDRLRKNVAAHKKRKTSLRSLNQMLSRHGCESKASQTEFMVG